MQLQGDRARFNRLQTRSGTREVRRSYEVSDSSWYNPFSWGRTRTEYYTDTVSYDYLNAADAIEQVRDYGNQCAEQMRGHINRLISPLELKNSLRKALLAHIWTPGAKALPGSVQGHLGRGDQSTGAADPGSLLG